jgi:hypothetical protein
VKKFVHIRKRKPIKGKKYRTIPVGKKGTKVTIMFPKGRRKKGSGKLQRVLKPK